VVDSEGITFGQVVSSPLLRAQQTAAAVAARLGLEVTVDALLTSGCSPDDVVALLSRLKANQSPLLVGHQPDLSTTVAVLTERHISFAQGDLAILERSSDGYELLRHIPANEQLR
jgi:phosphohistidine phosphatase SixA